VKILYLTVSVGGGHLKAAEAIMEEFQNKYPDSEHLIVDVLKYINPVLDKLVVGGYLGTIKKTPQLYRMLYEHSETGDNIYDFSNRVSHLLSSKIKDLMDEFKPDVIVCTHPFSMQLISRFKSKSRTKVPIVVILTDFIVHSFWLYDFVDAYVVAHEYMKIDMIRRGIESDRVFAYGIPVSPKFNIKNDRKKLMDEFGLEQGKHTALIMGGSLGYGKMNSSFKILSESKKDLQIIAITGRNQRQEQKFKRVANQSNKTMKVISYTDRVAEYMDVSDFIVTKPGGMTIAESLVKGLPMFIISPIPGQEEENAQFLLNIGCAARIWNHSNFDILLKETLENPLRLRHMKEMSSFLAKPYASENIIALIENLI